MEDAHLLMTRFTVPPLRAHLLPRDPLIERLNQSNTLPLVLLAAWASQHTHPVAWLTIDSRDNDPRRFWAR